VSFFSGCISLSLSSKQFAHSLTARTDAMKIKGKKTFLVTGAGSVRQAPPPRVQQHLSPRPRAFLLSLCGVGNNNCFFFPHFFSFFQGIGRGLCVRLAREGASGITLVDVSKAAADETQALATAASPSGCTTIVVVADVADGRALEAAFETHVQQFGTLHACFNNAGVEERKDWRSVVDINLSAVIHGTRLAVHAMTSTGSASPSSASSTTAIVNIASAVEGWHSFHNVILQVQPKAR
jgi:hypothetical protein